MRFKMDAMTVTRTVLSILAFANICLQMIGYNPIPIDEGSITTFVSLIFLGATSFESWRKNNNFTEEAHWAQNKLNTYKARSKYAKATGGVLDADIQRYKINGTDEIQLNQTM